MGSLDIDQLVKRFSGEETEITAVDNLKFEVKDGEFIVLVGPSGCGKSTTLRCIAGLEQPTEGDILIDGEVVTSDRPKDRDIAMVFQSYALYPHMTARENISFGLKMSTDMSDEVIETKVDEVAKMMGIEDLLEKEPSDLSGGQQQRVALGRAIVREPEVFLMDEPLSNLDAKLRTSMRTELQSLQEELGVTTVYVTHDQTEAMTMGDRIAILNNGRLQQIGTPLDCYYKPTNQFVASFIGSPSMNFIEAELDNKLLVHESFEVDLSNEFNDNLEQNASDVILGIRPEDIKLVNDKSQKTLTVTVQVTEPMGDQTNVYFNLGDEQYTAAVSGDMRIRNGQEINLSFPEKKVHVFDAETGKALKNSEYKDVKEAV